MEFEDCYGQFYRSTFYRSTTDKDAEITTFVHYSEPDAKKERDVFGQAKKGLFYNYDDRLIGERWTKGWELAKERGLKLKTARFYEEVLKYFHDSDDLNLQHIILGCNMSNGYSYLVFGYTYTSKSNQ
jgi:hypothetical protein